MQGKHTTVTVNVRPDDAWVVQFLQKLNFSALLRGETGLHSKPASERILSLWKHHALKSGQEAAQIREVDIDMACGIETHSKHLVQLPHHNSRCGYTMHQGNTH